MPTDVQPHGVGVIGSGPFHQYVIERLSLRRDFTATACCSTDGAAHSPNQRDGCVNHSSAQAVIDDPRTSVIFFVGPVATDLVAAAIRTGKHVVLELARAPSPQDLRHLAKLAAERGIIAVVDEPRRWEDDFLCAKSVFDAGQLGQLERIRLAIHERSLPGEVFPQGVLKELGCHWLDQLLAFVHDEPQSVRLRTFRSADSATDEGFLTVIDFIGGVSAVIEVQTQSLLSLRTGWLLEGTAGAYRAGRLYTKTADGEIIDEPVNRPPLFSDPAFSDPVSNDPFFDTLAAALRGDSNAQATLPDLAHAARVAELVGRVKGEG